MSLSPAVGFLLVRLAAALGIGFFCIILALLITLAIAWMIKQHRQALWSLANY